MKRADPPERLRAILPGDGVGAGDRLAAVLPMRRRVSRVTTHWLAEFERDGKLATWPEVQSMARELLQARDVIEKTGASLTPYLRTLDKVFSSRNMADPCGSCALPLDRCSTLPDKCCPTCDHVEPLR